MNNYMILNRTVCAYIVIGLLLYVALMLYWEDSVTYYNTLNVTNFVSYATILLISINKPDYFYTYKRLGITVFIYSAFFVGIYLTVSNYYTGDTFFADLTDPLQYAIMDKRIVEGEMSLFHVPAYLSNLGWQYDDWGAPFSQSLILKLFPSRYFLFFVQVLLGVCGALALFSIGKKVMQPLYAYICALSYSVASFSLYYYGSYRKEAIMVFIIIMCFWLFYQYISYNSKVCFALTLLLSSALFFFRPPVVVFFWVAMISFFVFPKGLNGRMLVITAIFLLLFSMASSVVFDSLDRYTVGGNITKAENYYHATPFSILVSSAGAMIGPFPQMLQLGQVKFSNLPMNGVGLLLKFLLFFSFWKGFALCLTSREKKVIPLFSFCILEMLGLALVNDGLELRKAMPHIPIFFLAAFWFMSNYDQDANAEIQRTPYYVWSRMQFSICIFLVLSATVAWNTFR